MKSPDLYNLTVSALFAFCVLCFGIGAGAGCAEWLEPATEARPCALTVDAAAELAAIDGSHVAALVRACKAEGAKTVRECKAAPAIDREYAARRLQWQECK